MTRDKDPDKTELYQEKENVHLLILSRKLNFRVRFSISDPVLRALILQEHWDAVVWDDGALQLSSLTPAFLQPLFPQPMKSSYKRD